VPRDLLLRLVEEDTMNEHIDTAAALRLARLTDDELRSMDLDGLRRVLRATQRGLRVVRDPAAERELLGLSRRANLIAAGARCDW